MFQIKLEMLHQPESSNLFMTFLDMIYEKLLKWSILNNYGQRIDLSNDAVEVIKVLKKSKTRYKNESKVILST